jgi:hypothetical protein
MDLGNWGGVSDGSGCDFGNGSNGGLDDSWSRTVNNSVESIDWISGVCNGTDGTIGLNKGVLSLDDISVTGFVGGLGVSGQTVRDGVSVVVLWMRVVGLSSDGLGNNWSSIADGLGYWLSISYGRGSVGSWGNNSSGSGANEGEDGDSLDHFV